MVGVKVGEECYTEPGSKIFAVNNVNDVIMNLLLPEDRKTLKIGRKEKQSRKVSLRLW